jgi:hypothetical protein
MRHVRYIFEANMMREALPWLTIAIFLAAGIWCLVGARRLQKRAIEVGETMRVNPFRSYIKSPIYVKVTQVIGAASIIVALLLLVLMIRGK